jgi:enoyl-CoA hydratase
VDQVARVTYEQPEPDIAVIRLNRPGKRNAQDVRMLYELNEAFNRGARDHAVKVIILAANGPHFSAGHDVTQGPVDLREFPLVSTWGGFDGEAVEKALSFERETYVELYRRWRNIPKPTIAEVHGYVITGGLSLIWPCDLIVASEDTVFKDHAMQVGIPGTEYFAHPAELGPRKAKEFLFTCDSWTAEEAYRLGMVNHVVPREELSGFTLGLARRVARQSALALKLAKEAVNHATDSQGQWESIQYAFALHHLGHAHNRELYGGGMDPKGVERAWAHKQADTPA